MINCDKFLIRLMGAVFPKYPNQIRSRRSDAVICYTVPDSLFASGLVPRRSIPRISRVVCLSEAGSGDSAGEGRFALAVSCFAVP